MCHQCLTFLHDFLEISLDKDLPITKQIHMKSLKHVQSELVHWFYNFYKRLPKEDFDKALETASRIARRGRPAREYEHLIQTATFNFLKFSVDWIKQELNYIQPLLLESGFIRSYQKHGDMNAVYNYVSYMTPRVYLVLHNLHEDHIHPKGIYTDLNKLFLKPKPEPKQFLDVDELYN